MLAFKANLENLKISKEFEKPSEADFRSTMEVGMLAVSQNIYDFAPCVKKIEVEKFAAANFDTGSRINLIR